MATFKYRAKDGVNNIEGVLEAQSREEAVEKINQMGYLPVRVEEEKHSQISSPKAIKSMSSIRVKSRDITLFSRQLASLIRSGVGILSALDTLSNQVENQQFKLILKGIKDEVANGKAFSLSLADYPNIFPPLYIAMVRSGESSGALEKVLVRIADYRKKQEEVIAHLKTALAYPTLMAIVGAGTIFFMLTFVMPRLMGIFARLGQELPLPTRVLLFISSIFQNWWVLILLVLAGVILIVKKGFKAKKQKMLISRFSLYIPILRDFVRKSELARFARTLEVLLDSGVSILKAIEVTIPILDNEIIKEELTRSYKQLEHGGSFGKSLENSKLFPGFMTSLIIIGEESGRLDESLAELASSYERDTDEILKMITALLEPLLILVMGLIVGFIVISMLLPIFQMNMMAR